MCTHRTREVVVVGMAMLQVTPHGQPWQLQLWPGRLPPSGHAGEDQNHHRGGQHETALGQRPQRLRNQHQGRGLCGGGGQSPGGPAGRRRGAH